MADLRNSMNMMALTGINWNLTSSIFFTLLGALVAVYSWVVPQGDKRWWGEALLMTAFVVAALQPVNADYEGKLHDYYGRPQR